MVSFFFYNFFHSVSESLPGHPSGFVFIFLLHSYLTHLPPIHAPVPVRKPWDDHRESSYLPPPSKYARIFFFNRWGEYDNPTTDIVVTRKTVSESSAGVVSSNYFSVKFNGVRRRRIGAAHAHGAARWIIWSLAAARVCPAVPPPLWKLFLDAHER